MEYYLIESDDKKEFLEKVDKFLSGKEPWVLYGDLIINVFPHASRELITHYFQVVVKQDGVIKDR